MQTLAMEQPRAAALAGRHSAALSVSLHLLPGVLIGAVYFLLAPLAARLGLPSITALMAAAVLALIPFELGVIAWAARSARPRPVPFMELIAYRQPLAPLRLLGWALLALFATGLLFGLLNPLTAWLQAQFDWLPESMALAMGNEGGYARATLVWVTALNALLLALAAPVVEELYFRGFLLPRMPESLKGWAPLAHSFLFALYHVWSPWMIVARTIGLLPLVYAVRRTRSVYVGMIAHCLVNFIDVAAMIAFISAMD